MCGVGFKLYAYCGSCANVFLTPFDLVKKNAYYAICLYSSYSPSLLSILLFLYLFLVIGVGTGWLGGQRGRKHQNSEGA